MLVISDQIPIICSWKCCLSCSRESKEKADVVWVSFANIATWVKWKMTFLWHKVVHDRKNSFLHLTCVLTTQNDHLSLLEVKTDSNVSNYIRDVFVSHKFTGIKNIVISSVREISPQFSCSRSDKHIGHKESMVRTSTHNSDSDSIFRAPSSISINYIDLSSSVEVALSQTSKDLERLSSYRFIHISPSNILLANWVIDYRFGSRWSSELMYCYPVFKPE